MKTRFDIGDKELKNIISKVWAINATKIRFLPLGEENWAYIVEDNDGKKYFLKMYGKKRKIEQVKESLSVIHYLYAKHDIKNIIHPISTTIDSVYYLIKGHIAVLFNFIDGENQDNLVMTDDQLKNLARTLAKIHKITPRMFQIKNKEKFTISCDKQLENSIKYLEKPGNLSNTYKKQLAQLILPSKKEILSAIERLKEIKQSIRLKKEDYVICHCDPIHLNLIINGEEVSIIDWDDARLAPKEQDLWFYLNTRAPIFLNAYRETYGSFKLNTNVISFYFYNRFLDDLRDWVVRIIEGKGSKEQNESDLQGVRHDCLSIIGKLEIELQRKLSIAEAWNNRQAH